MSAEELLECGRCEVVNLFGLVQLCEFRPAAAPTVRGSDRHLADAVARQHDRMSIYVPTADLRRFVRRTLPRLRSTFVLFTGLSDMTAPVEALSRPELRRLLGSPLLIRWYAQNCIAAGPKLAALPIGVRWPPVGPGPALSPLAAEALFLRARAEAPAARAPLIYSRLKMGNDRFGDRWAALDAIPAELFAGGAAYVASAGDAPPTPTLEYWRGLAAHAFCLSPFGVGLDCYRTWEALAMGAIPIVRCGARRPFAGLFAGLPVLAVAEWRDVTRERLDRALREFGAPAAALPDRLRLQHWREELAALCAM